MSTTELRAYGKPYDTNWVKIKGAQLKVNLHIPIVHKMLIKKLSKNYDDPMHSFRITRM